MVVGKPAQKLSGAGRVPSRTRWRTSAASSIVSSANLCGSATLRGAVFNRRITPLLEVVLELPADIERTTAPERAGLKRKGWLFLVDVRPGCRPASDHRRAGPSARRRLEQEKSGRFPQHFRRFGETPDQLADIGFTGLDHPRNQLFRGRRQRLENIGLDRVCHPRAAYPGASLPWQIGRDLARTDPVPRR